MVGFDINGFEKIIKNRVEERFSKGETLVRNELTSPGYSDVISAVKVGKNLEELQVRFKNGITIEGQNVLQVFAYGGQVEKDGEYINIYPSAIIRKYLGTRK